jgi:uncharacterized membrane protein YkvA (DUF1232 family)
MNNSGKQNNGAHWPPVVIYLTGIVGLVYLLNPTLGVLELIPDNLPIVGNLDEGAAAILLWNAVQQLRSLRKSR